MALLDGDLQKEIGTDPDVLAIMLDGVLSHKSKTLVNGSFVVTSTNYPINGFYDMRKDAVYLGGGKAQRIALILAYNLPVVPQPQDTITIHGVSNSIITVESDPATATYTLVLAER